MSLTFHKSGRDEVCVLCEQPIAAGESRWRRAKGADVSYEHTSCPEEHLTARLPDGLYDALGLPVHEE
jgi:hypothetical protein